MPSSRPSTSGMTNKTLTYHDLLITPTDVYEQMGYHEAEPDETTRRETQAVMSDVSQWLRPQYCFQVVRQLPDFDMGKIILRQLRGAEAYALFVCTAGVEYEAFQQRLKREDDMVRIFIADALGSVVAEKTADRMEDALQESIDNWVGTIPTASRQATAAGTSGSNSCCSRSSKVTPAAWN